MSRLIPTSTSLNLPGLGRVNVFAFTVRVILGPEFDFLRALQPRLIAVSPLQALAIIMTERRAEALALIDIACKREPGWAERLNDLQTYAIANAIYGVNQPPQREAGDSSKTQNQSGESGKALTLEELIAQLTVERSMRLDDMLELTLTQLMALYEAHVRSTAKARAESVYDMTAAVAGLFDGKAVQEYAGRLIKLADGGR